jgi:hypothetical protein
MPCAEPDIPGMDHLHDPVCQPQRAQGGGPGRAVEQHEVVPLRLYADHRVQLCSLGPDPGRERLDTQRIDFLVGSDPVQGHHTKIG